MSNYSAIYQDMGEAFTRIIECLIALQKQIIELDKRITELEETNNDRNSNNP